MLNENLREKREQAELTQNEVAEQLHVSPQSISKWERGEALPSVEFLPKLAEIYCCKIDDFFNENAVVEDVKIPQSGLIDKFFKEIKKLYDGYKQGQEVVLDEKYKFNLEFLKKILEFMKKSNVLTISGLQRRFCIGYARAGSIVDGIDFLELTKFDSQDLSHYRVVDQKKLADFIAFLNKLD